MCRNVQQRAEEAVILDMGQYSSAAPLPIAKKMPAAAAPVPTPASASSGVIKAQMPARRTNSSHSFITRDQGSGPRDQAAALAAERAQERAAAARAAAAAKENEEMPSTWNIGDNAAGGNVGSPGSSTLQPMHLFQVGLLCCRCHHLPSLEHSKRRSRCSQCMYQHIKRVEAMETGHTMYVQLYVTTLSMLCCHR